MEGLGPQGVLQYLEEFMKSVDLTICKILSNKVSTFSIVPDLIINIDQTPSSYIRVCWKADDGKAGFTICSVVKDFLTKEILL